jgi:hypothetical protein
MDDRYNQYHTLGDVEFYLDDYEIDYEECCFILLKVVEQAIRDYCLLPWSHIPYKQEHWETARDFIFDDNYEIDWGNITLSLGNICEILAFSEQSKIDIDWIRRKTKEKYETEKKKRG